MKYLFKAILLAFVTTHVAAQTSINLFNGQSLEGWKVSDSKYNYLWKVEQGVIKGGDLANNVPVNSYLCTEREYENFEFRCLFRLTGDTTGFVNSGIQYRSFLKDKQMIGYQADIGNGYWGDIYDEHRRGKLVGGDLSVLKTLLIPFGWNSYIIRCIDDRHQLYINGIQVADYIEKDKTFPKKGIIGIQIHDGGKALIEVKNITIETL